MVRPANLDDAHDVRRLSEQFSPPVRWGQSAELFAQEYRRIISDESYLLAVADGPDHRLTGYLLAQDHDHHPEFSLDLREQ